MQARVLFAVTISALLQSAASALTYSPRKNFYTVAQMSRFVAPGDVRIDAATAASVQLRRHDGQLCLGATFSSPFQKQDMTRLRARSD